MCIRDSFIPGLVPQYTRVNGVAYAFPETPSAQLLFYRKDLFENTVLQRLYKEQYKDCLCLLYTSRFLISGGMYSHSRFREQCDGLSFVKNVQS